MSEVIASHRYYALHRLLTTTKSFATDEQISFLLAEKVYSEIAKASEALAAMLEEQGDTLHDYEINTKPFGVDKQAFVLIEIVFYVRSKARKPDGLRVYRYQNLYQADGEGWIDIVGDSFRHEAGLCQWIFEHSEGGDGKEILLIDVEGVWYEASDEIKQEIQNGQEQEER